MEEMEATQRLEDLVDQIRREIYQASMNSVSCGACGMTGHQTSECLQANWDNNFTGMYGYDSQVAGNPYINPYNHDWRNHDLYYETYPQQPHTQYQNHLPDFSPYISDSSFYNPVQETLVDSEESRIEKLLEQFILYQQECAEENEQRFQQIFNMCDQNEQRFQQIFNMCDQMQTTFDQMQTQNEMLESQIAQLSAGTLQWDDEELPSQIEANTGKGADEIILQSEEQMETHEPEGQGSEQYLIETPASNFSTYTDSCFLDIVYDRFMELEKSETEELPRQFEANPIEGADESILEQEGQMKTPEPELQMETEHQHEMLTSEVNNVPKFFANTDTYFMNDVVARFMESHQDESCKDYVMESYIPGGAAEQNEGYEGFIQSCGSNLLMGIKAIRPPLHDLKIMKWWDTG